VNSFSRFSGSDTIEANKDNLIQTQATKFDDSDDDEQPINRMVEADRGDPPLKVDPKYLVKSE